MLRTELLKTASAAALPIPLEDVKLDLRVDSDDEDATIERLIRAAAAFLERRTGWAVTPGRYRALYSEWPCSQVEIYRAPLRALESIEYLSAADTWTEVDVANFQVSRRQKSFIIAPLSTFTPPELFTCLDSVRFTFAAGFDAEDPGSTEDAAFVGDELPMDPDVRTLLTMLVAHFYKNRELVAADNMAQVEHGAAALLGAHRTYW